MKRSALALLPGALILVACGPKKQTLYEAVGIDVAVDSLPRGATVTEDGNVAGTTPLRFDVKDDQVHVLTVKKDGFHAADLTVKGDEIRKAGGGRLEVALAPESFETKQIAWSDQGQIMRAAGELLARNKASDAEAFSRHAISLNASYAPAYKSLGMALGKQGKREAALDAYRQYLLRWPEAPDAKKVREIVDKASGGFVIRPEETR